MFEGNKNLVDLFSHESGPRRFGGVCRSTWDESRVEKLAGEFQSAREERTPLWSAPSRIAGRFGGGGTYPSAKGAVSAPRRSADGCPLTLDGDRSPAQKR